MLSKPNTLSTQPSGVLAFSLVQAEQNCLDLHTSSKNSIDENVLSRFILNHYWELQPKFPL